MKALRILLVTISASCSVIALEAQTSRTLVGQIHDLGRRIKDNLQTNPLVQNQKLTLGEFDGKGGALGTNFGLRIKTLLRSELASQLVEQGDYTLSGGYVFVKSSDPAERGAQVVLLNVRIENDRGKEVVALEAEINDSDEISQILGLTNANTKPDFKQRNEATHEAQVKPTFELQHGTRVSAKGMPQLSMQVLKKPTATGTAIPIAPQNVKGLAYAPVEIHEHLEIELFNDDKFDMVATLTVDGLETVNTFSEDKNAAGEKIRWPGYFVPAGSSIRIRGWLHTIDQSRKDNLFSFRVAKLGEGAASALNTRGSVGVITVQFREACPPDGQLSGRSFGEIAKGDALPEKLKTVPVLIGQNVLSTVSIRYNRPE